MQRYPYALTGDYIEQKAMVHPPTAVSSSFFHQMRPDITFGATHMDPLSTSLGLGANMAGAQDPIRMAMQIQQLMCKVCGDTASGNHFGVLSCEACKSFFRRSVRSASPYACRGTRDCNIQKTTRNRCQYCRLQKCTAVGMRKEAVQEERKPTTARADEPESPTKSTISSGLPHSPTTPTVPGGLVPRFHSSLPNLPHNVSPSQDSTVSKDNTVSDPSLTLEALVEAEEQISEPTSQYSLHDTTISTNEVFQAAKESLIRIIEWSKHVPTFTSLPLPDQVKLLKCTWAEVMMLRLAIRTADAHKVGKSGIVLATGKVATPENTEDLQLSSVFLRVQEELTEWLVSNDIDRKELTLLQALILFNPDAKGLSASAAEKVAQVQKQLLNMLQSTSAAFPSDRHRFPLMLLRLRNIKSISIDVVQHMEVHRTIGDAHLDRIFVELMDMSS